MPGTTGSELFSGSFGMFSGNRNSPRDDAFNALKKELTKDFLNLATTSSEESGAEEMMSASASTGAIPSHPERITPAQAAQNLFDTVKNSTQRAVNSWSINEAKARQELLISAIKSEKVKADPAFLGEFYRTLLKKECERIMDLNPTSAQKMWGHGESEEQKTADTLSRIASEAEKLDAPRLQLEEKADKALERANQTIQFLAQNKITLADQAKKLRANKEMSRADWQSRAADLDKAATIASTSISSLEAKVKTLTDAKNEASKNPYAAPNYKKEQMNIKNACDDLQKTLNQSIDRENLNAAFTVLRKDKISSQPTKLSVDLINTLKAQATTDPTYKEILAQTEKGINSLNENIDRLHNLTPLMVSKNASKPHENEYKALLKQIQKGSDQLSETLMSEQTEKYVLAISNQETRQTATEKLHELTKRATALYCDAGHAINVQAGWPEILSIKTAENEKLEKLGSFDGSLAVNESHSSSLRDEISRACVITYYERVPKENGMGHEFKKRTITDLTLSQTRNLAELWNGEAGWNYCKEKGIEWHPVDISKNFFNDGFQLRFNNKELKNEFITGFREKILGNQKTSIAEKAASANGTVTSANPAPTPSALPAIPGLTQ